MFSTCQEVTVSKIEMASIQLDAAIAAYFDGQGVVAITLAGAAEEIFGAMLRHEGIENSVKKIASLPQMLKISADLPKRIDFLNDVRNNLKHARDKREDRFVITEFDPYIMIVRALGNASLLEIADSELMSKFKKFHTPKV